MGTISPTDADSGVNGEFSCSGSSTASSATTYYSIGADCGQFLIRLNNKVNKIRLNSHCWWLMVNTTHFIWINLNIYHQFLFMWLFLIASRSIWTAVFNVTLYERTHKKGMMIKLILRQPWLKFFRSLSVILPIRELGLRHDFEIYYHSGRQGFPGPDRNHLRRHHLQRGHHHHNHNYCSALYLQLLGWQRRCGGFLYRHGSRFLLNTIKISWQQNHLHRLFSWKDECNSEAQWN